VAQLYSNRISFLVICHLQQLHLQVAYACEVWSTCLQLVKFWFTGLLCLLLYHSVGFGCEKFMFQELLLNFCSCEVRKCSTVIFWTGVYLCKFIVEIWFEFGRLLEMLCASTMWQEAKYKKLVLKPPHTARFKANKFKSAYLHYCVCHLRLKFCSVVLLYMSDVQCEKISAQLIHYQDHYNCR